MVLIDSVSRYVEGVLSKDSICEESFSNDLLEYPQYTRPEIFEGKEVPEVLKSGNHQNIAKWRRDISLVNTYQKRPDLLDEKKKEEAKNIIRKNEEVRKENIDGYHKINRT